MTKRNNEYRSTRMPLISAPLIAILYLYRRLVSPLLPPFCRFTPTCSEYAMEAIHEHGPLAGGWMALTRVLRCHPGHAGGGDPVPRRAGSEEGISDGSSDSACLCSTGPRPVPVPVSDP